VKDSKKSTSTKAPMPSSPTKAKPTGKAVKGDHNPGIPVASKQGNAAVPSKKDSHGGKAGAGKAGL
jgi:hypothetical protein